MSSASCRLALPENTSIELYGTSGPLVYRGLCCFVCFFFFFFLFGVFGFVSWNAGIKIQCLTALRHPNKTLVTRCGRPPSNAAARGALQTVMKRGAIAALRGPRAPRGRSRRGDSLRRRLIRAGREHRRAGAAHPSWAILLQPGEGLRHLRITALHHGLADVGTGPGKK